MGRVLFFGLALLVASPAAAAELGGLAGHIRTLAERAEQLRGELEALELELEALAELGAEVTATREQLDKLGAFVVGEAWADGSFFEDGTGWSPFPDPPPPLPPPPPSL